MHSVGVKMAWWCVFDLNLTSACHHALGAQVLEQKSAALEASQSAAYTAESGHEEAESKLQRQLAAQQAQCSHLQVGRAPCCPLADCNAGAVMQKVCLDTYPIMSVLRNLASMHNV